MTGFTLHPNEAETAWDARPSGLKRAGKEERREVRGRSSLTTTHVLTHERSIPLAFGGRRETKSIIIRLTADIRLVKAVLYLEHVSVAPQIPTAHINSGIGAVGVTHWEIIECNNTCAIYTDKVLLHGIVFMVASKYSTATKINAEILHCIVYLWRSRG